MESGLYPKKKGSEITRSPCVSDHVRWYPISLIGSQEIRGASTGYSGRVWQQTRRLPRDLLGDPSSSSIAIFLDPAYSLIKRVWRIAKIDVFPGLQAGERVNSSPVPNKKPLTGR